MIYGALREFSDIHTHIQAGPQSICSLPPKEAIALSRSDINQPYSIMLHPWYLNEELLEEFLDALEICRQDSRFVAIGECGLDSNSETDFSLQEKYFEIALQKARELDKPVILHIVKSWEALIKITMRVFEDKNTLCNFTERSPIIIHGFRKNAELAKQLISLGFSISLGKRYNQDVIATIDKEKIYFETDESAM